MARILVLQNMTSDGPAYLGRWLREQGHQADVRNAEAGGGWPSSLDGYHALALLGGAMSANDELPWLRQSEQLFREALRRGVPTLGHCLGGQLMSRALGASVHRSPAPEVGFHDVQFDAAAAAWFGSLCGARFMHWHYEAFEVPAGVGARRVATSAACPVQAWSLGPHLAMQFHIEVDAVKVLGWCEESDGQGGRQEAHGPTEHDTARIRADLARLIDEHQALAARLYANWLVRLDG
jgi:GMP synthase (glutamine-hydrolysing)